MNRACFAVGLLAALALVLPHDAFARILQLGGGTAVTCAATATAADDTSVPDTVARYVTICNPSSATQDVYVGGSSVTSSTGTPVAAGKCWSSVDLLAAGTTAYCIVASGTQSVRVSEAKPQ